MDVVMTNLSEDDDSSWLHAQDVHSMHVADHLFGPNLLSSAIVMERLCDLSDRHRLQHHERQTARRLVL